MGDLNFFHHYIEKNELKIDKKIIYIAISISICFFLICYGIYNQVMIMKEIKAVENLKKTAEDMNILKRIEEIKSKENEVSNLKKIMGKAATLDETIEKRDISDEDILNKIYHSIPENLYLTSLSINSSEVNITGLAKDKLSIAKFQSGLMAVDNYEDSFIAHISIKEGYYDFTLNVTMKGVSDDGKTIEK